MIRLPRFVYRQARSLTEALDMMVAASGTGSGQAGQAGGAVYLAGGTDLLPNMKHRLCTPSVVIGLGAIPAMGHVAYDPADGLRLGAGVSLAQLAADPLVRLRYSALGEAGEAVATPQLRQMGTLGGNLCLDTRCRYYNQSEVWRAARGSCLKHGGDTCWAAPARSECHAVSSGDTAPALLALDAAVTIASTTGERVVPLADLHHGDGVQAVQLGAGELLTDVYLPPLEDDWRSTYVKARIRAAVDFPIASAAVAACFDGDVCREVRLSLQAVASHPLRVPEAEQILREQRWTEEIVEAAAEQAAATAHPQDNTAGSVALRRRMAKACTRRALLALTGPRRRKA